MEAKAIKTNWGEKKKKMSGEHKKSYNYFPSILPVYYITFYLSVLFH